MNNSLSDEEIAEVDEVDEEEDEEDEEDAVAGGGVGGAGVHAGHKIPYGAIPGATSYPWSKVPFNQTIPPRLDLYPEAKLSLEGIGLRRVSIETLEECITKNLFPRIMFDVLVRMSETCPSAKPLLETVCIFIFTYIIEAEQSKKRDYFQLVAKQIPLPEHINVKININADVYEDNIITFDDAFMATPHSMFLGSMEHFYAMIELVNRGTNKMLHQHVQILDMFIKNWGHGRIKFLYFCCFLNHLCQNMQALDVLFYEDDEYFIDMSLLKQLFYIFNMYGFFEVDPTLITIKVINTNTDPETETQITYKQLINILFSGFEPLGADGTLNIFEGIVINVDNVYHINTLVRDDLLTQLYRILTITIFEPTRFAWVCAVARAQLFKFRR